MPEEIIMIYRWTLEEYLRSCRWHSRQLREPINPWTPRVLGMIFVALGAYQYFRVGMVPQVWWSLGGGFFFICWLDFVRFLQTWLNRRNFAKIPSRNTEIEWRIGEAGLRVIHIYGNSECTWQAWHKAVQTPDGLLLYPQPLLFHWLPRHAFVTEADYETVARLVQSHVPAFRKVA